MSEVNTIAVLSPSPGKSDRVKQLFTQMIKDVHSKEDDTLRYMMTEQVEAENPDIVMIETYKSKEAVEKHAQTEHFKQLFATLDKEGLMAKAPYLAHTVTRAGFDLDRKLV